MPPRPSDLEEPDFADDTNITVTNYWQKPTGLHNWTLDKIGLQFLRGDLIPENRDFLFSEHEISPDGNAWEPSHVLGQGAFGTAGLWIKRNLGAEVVDEMVIKENFDFIPDWQIEYGIHREASIQRDAQRQAHQLLGTEEDADLPRSGQHQILHLRNYKFNIRDTRCRFYTIYTPHYTLEDLLSRYKAFGNLLPEPFIWHVAHSLALAVSALSGPLHPTSLFRKHFSYSDDAFIVHADMKPENVFLDYAPLADKTIDAMYKTPDVSSPDFNPIATYPSIKLADFGVSDYTFAGDGGPTRHGGTPGYMPPEQTNFGNWFDPDVQPNRDAESARAHNVYGVGRVLFDCFFLLHWDVLSRMAMPDGQGIPQQPYLTMNHHILPANFANAYPHSARLWKLIRKCLSPICKDRFTPAELELETKEGLEEACRNLAKVVKVTATTNKAVHTDPPPWRLYYRGNEIESSPRGLYDFDEKAWNARVAKRRDRSGKSLQLPKDRFPRRVQRSGRPRPSGKADAQGVNFRAGPDFIGPNPPRRHLKFAPDRIDAFATEQKRIFREEYNLRRHNHQILQQQRRREKEAVEKALREQNLRHQVPRQRTPTGSSTGTQIKLESLSSRGIAERQEIQQGPRQQPANGLFTNTPPLNPGGPTSHGNSEQRALGQSEIPWEGLGDRENAPDEPANPEQQRLDDLLNHPYFGRPHGADEVNGGSDSNGREPDDRDTSEARSFTQRQQGGNASRPHQSSTRATGSRVGTPRLATQQRSPPRRSPPSQTSNDRSTSRQSQPQVPAQPLPQPLPAHQAPTWNDYNRLTIRDLGLEIRQRREPMPGKHARKSDYIQALQAADVRGNHGNGARKARKKQRGRR